MSTADELVQSGAKEVKDPSPEQVQQAYQSLEQEINHLIAKMSELDEEVRCFHSLFQAFLRLKYCFIRQNPYMLTFCEGNSVYEKL